MKSRWRVGQIRQNVQVMMMFIKCISNQVSETGHVLNACRMFVRNRRLRFEKQTDTTKEKNLAGLKTYTYILWKSRILETGTRLKSREYQNMNTKIVWGLIRKVVTFRMEMKRF